MTDNWDRTNRPSAVRINTIDVTLLHSQVQLQAAHIENLIERMAEMEKAHEFEWLGQCHQCRWTVASREVEWTNESCAEHQRHNDKHWAYVSSAVDHGE